MRKLSISIVLYKSDLLLLKDVIFSILREFTSMPNNDSWFLKIDLINNEGNSINDEFKNFVNINNCPRIELNIIQSTRNGGYGAGNNISIKSNIDSDYHLVLNPDVLLGLNSLRMAVDFMDKNLSVGLLTPKILNFEGLQQYLCKRNPKLVDMFIRGCIPQVFQNLFLNRQMKFEMRNADYDSVIQPIEYPTGCFMFFRNDTLQKINGFDENYFLHYEDADIGRRLMAISTTAYVPDVVIKHKWARDTHKRWIIRWITVKSGLRYWYKWGGIF